MPEAGHGAEEYDLLAYATGRGHLYVDHPLHHPFSHPFRPSSAAALAVACGRSRETAPTAPLPEVPEEDVEAVPPLGGVVPPAPPSAEDGPPTEEPPPGEERPERHGETPTAPIKPARRPAAGRGAARRPIGAT